MSSQERVLEPALARAGPTPSTQDVSPLGGEGDKVSLSIRSRSLSTRTYRAQAEAVTPFRVEGDTASAPTLTTACAHGGKMARALAASAMAPLCFVARVERELRLRPRPSRACTRSPEVVRPRSGGCHVRAPQRCFKLVGYECVRQECRGRARGAPRPPDPRIKSNGRMTE